MLRPKAFLTWAGKVFGPIAFDRTERTARFVEEAIELAHAQEFSRETLNRIVDRVYSRPPGNIAKEIGQAMATLEVLAENIGLSADAEAEREFARVQSIPRDEWMRRHDAKVALQIASNSERNPCTSQSSVTP